MSGPSKPRPKLCGAHVWARWSLVPPKYELWRYVGPAVIANEIAHHFIPLKGGMSIYMTMNHLTRNVNHFKPFCLTTDDLPKE